MAKDYGKQGQGNGRDSQAENSGEGRPKVARQPQSSMRCPSEFSVIGERGNKYGDEVFELYLDVLGSTEAAIGEIMKLENGQFLMVRGMWKAESGQLKLSL